MDFTPTEYTKEQEEFAKEVNKWLDEKNLADAKNAALTAEEEAAIVAFLKEIGAEYHISEPTLP